MLYENYKRKHKLYEKFKKGNLYQALIKKANEGFIMGFTKSEI